MIRRWLEKYDRLLSPKFVAGESYGGIRGPKIVRNLLTFARKRQSTRTTVDMNQVVRETLALRAYEQRVTNITVIDALAAGLPAVFADAHQTGRSAAPHGPGAVVGRFEGIDVPLDLDDRARWTLGRE